MRDNSATHNTPRVRHGWRRPHWHMPFIPTSASWPKQAEARFAALIRKHLQHGVHHCVAEREADIAVHNHKPYKWAKPADKILALVRMVGQKHWQELRIQVSRA